MNVARIFFLLVLIVGFVAGGYVYAFGDMKSHIENMGLILDSKEGMENGEDAGNLVAGNAVAGNLMAGNLMAGNAVASSECPDLLIQQGKLVYLWNTKKAEKAGENPMLFNNLDEYIKFRETSGTDSCPILYLQSGYNTQGQETYAITSFDPNKPIPGTTLGSLPLTSSVAQPANTGSARAPIEVEDASRDNGYNKNMYAGFDPHNMYIGKYTVVDKIHDSTMTKTGVLSENPMDPNWGGISVTQQAVDSGKYDENLVVPQSYTTPKGGAFMPIPNDTIPKYPANSTIQSVSGRTGRVTGGALQ